MALDPATQFVETSLTSAEFDPQDKVLGNSAVESNDVNAIASRALRRAAYLRQSLLVEKIIPYVFTAVPTTPFAIGAPIAGSAYADSTITVDVLNTQAGDDLRIRAWGTWQLNATSSPGDVAGKARIRVTEDVAGTPAASSPIGEATIYDDNGVFAVPHNEPYVLDVRFRCTTPGTTRVTVQAKYQDLTGGAATGTVVFMFSARLDVDHYVRQ